MSEAIDTKAIEARLAARSGKGSGDISGILDFVLHADDDIRALLAAHKEQAAEIERLQARAKAVEGKICDTCVGSSSKPVVVDMRACRLRCTCGQEYILGREYVHKGEDVDDPAQTDEEDGQLSDTPGGIIKEVDARYYAWQPGYKPHWRATARTTEASWNGIGATCEEAIADAKGAALRWTVRPGTVEDEQMVTDKALDEEDGQWET